MSDDALAEVRRIRHQISAECGHKVHDAAAYYRQIEQELRRSGRFRFEEPSLKGVVVRRLGQPNEPDPPPNRR